MKTIEISERDSGGCLAVDLRDVLAAIEVVGKVLTWKICSIVARGDISAFWPDGMLAFEAAVENAREGMELEWSELVSLGNCIEQTQDCKLIGLDRATNEKVVCLEAIDSDYWRVVTTDDAVSSMLSDRFGSVRTLDS